MSEFYDAVMVLHVLAAIAGFGALAATGGYATAARNTPTSPAVRRYFAPSPGYAPWILLAVPVLGLALLGLGHWHDLRHPYPWVGMGVWLCSAAVASVWIWPTERALKAALSKETAPDPAWLSAAARRAGRAAVVTSIGFVIALFFMAAQPG